MAIIEFSAAGTVCGANKNFCDLMGFSLDEIVGRHHRQFVEPDYAQSAEYQDFWATLCRGQFVAAEFKRVAKGGRRVWLQASYNPVRDRNGRLLKVVKIATDITARIAAVTAIGDGLDQLSRQNLDHRIEEKFAPEFEPLRDNFNISVQQMRAAMGRVIAGVTAIRSATDQLGAASDGLSRRTEQQAASLEQTATELDRITAIVRSTAQGATQACDVVAAARSTAEISGGIVHHAAATVGQIETRRRKISHFIGAIDEIARQTELLAADAGRQAASAGDAGHPFAAAACQVRDLAQRSALVAQEMKALVAIAGEDVQTCVAFVGAAGNALSRIVGHITNINGVICGIAAAARDQATGLQHVNMAVGAMDQISQQNAVMAEQSTLATHSMSREVGRLAQVVGAFHIGDAASRPHGPALADPASARAA